MKSEETKFDVSQFKCIVIANKKYGTRHEFRILY